MNDVVAELLTDLFHGAQHGAPTIVGGEQARFPLFLIRKMRQLDTEKAKSHFARISPNEKVTDDPEDGGIVVGRRNCFRPCNGFEIGITDLQRYGPGLSVFGPKP